MSDRRVFAFLVSCLSLSLVCEAQFGGFIPQPPPQPPSLNLTTFELNRLQELVDSLQIEQYDKFLVDKVRQVFPHQMTQRMVIDRLPLFNSPPSLSMVLSNLTDPKIQEIKQMKNHTQIPALISVYRELLTRVTPSEVRMARNILAPLLFGNYNVVEGLGNPLFPRLPNFPLNPNGGGQISQIPQIPQIGNQISPIPQISNQMGQIPMPPPTSQGMNFGMPPFGGNMWYGWPKPTPIYWPTYSMFLQKPFWPRQRY